LRVSGVLGSNIPIQPPGFNNNSPRNDYNQKLLNFLPKEVQSEILLKMKLLRVFWFKSPIFHLDSLYMIHMERLFSVLKNVAMNLNGVYYVSLRLLFDWIDLFLLKVDFYVRFCTTMTLHCFVLWRYSLHVGYIDEKVSFFL